MRRGTKLGVDEYECRSGDEGERGRSRGQELLGQMCGGDQHAGSWEPDSSDWFRGEHMTQAWPTRLGWNIG